MYLLGAHAERARGVAKDTDIHLRIAELEAAAHVLLSGDGREFRLESRRRLVERSDIGPLQHVLVLTAAAQATDAYRRRNLEEHLHLAHLRHGFAQLLQDLFGARRALLLRLQTNEHAAVVAASCAAASLARARHRHNNKQKLPHDVRDALLQGLELLEGDALRRLGVGDDLSRVLARYEALGHDAEE